MIASSVIREIERLLADGFSWQRVRVRTRVSLGTIRRVATRRITASRRRRREEVSTVDKPRGPARKCACCGKLVKHPCQVCRGRNGRLSLLPKRKLRRLLKELPGQLHLDLRPAQQKRYEEVRAKRESRDRRRRRGRLAYPPSTLASFIPELPQEFFVEGPESSVESQTLDNAPF